MQSVTGLILAGGRGERMGGADKGWVVHEGRPLIVSVVERFAPQVSHLLISANRNLERYAALGEIIEDDNAAANGERFAGPLVGVLSGLRRARTEWLAIVPCDAPRLPRDLVQRLTSTALNSNATAVCARANNQLQPTFALIKTDQAVHLDRAIAAGERAMHRWLASLDAVPVDFDEAASFTNINEPELR